MTSDMGEDELRDGADHVADTMKFMLTSKKFKSKFPQVHKLIRQHIRTLSELEAGMEDEADSEDEAEGVKKQPVDAAQAQKLFQRHNANLLQDIAKKRFGQRFKTK